MSSFCYVVFKNTFEDKEMPTASAIKQGDFSSLAKEYINRPGYSEIVLDALASYVGAARPDFRVADVGAGTGKLTENLLSLELKVVAVEPNDEMRAEGISYTAGQDVEWRKGSGEHTGLPDAAFDWLLMGSAFHWVNLQEGLKEFHRVLKPGGFFTCLWNPRDLERSDLHRKIEARIYELAPHINRVSSGSSQYTLHLFDDLISTGHFKNVLFSEARHEVAMTKERYIGAWRSVNDIQAQAGPQVFEKIITAIEEEIADLDEVIVPYKTRAWTVQSCR
jgi:ubiquinone/menaquinone biosynthesis C-methylase UbiE